MALLNAMKNFVEPDPRLNATDSLNVNLGVLNNYANKLKTKIMSKNFEDNKNEMLSGGITDAEKHGAAMELMDAIAYAKKYKLPIASAVDKLSPMAKILHENFVQRVSNQAIADNKHKDYQKIGEGIEVQN
jgi:hypothetical protein